MSVDLTAGPGGSGQQPTDEEVIAMAREAIELSRDEMRRGRDGVLSTDLQQPGVTVDLGHRSIARLPDEVIDIIKDEIERLAISHNRVGSFPNYISECTRLRYLNARYNALRDFPAPILQLSSLEILDLSRNRIKRIPEDISNLSSLRVLAIQKNKIERLPLSLGDMVVLRMLKFDDNPIVFPPPDVLQLDATTASNASGNEVEALLTTQVKKYLKQASNAATNRQRLQVESDSEASEDAMETPRPPRPAGTRFPVRPSISGLESLGIPSSISPEAVATPSIPPRSHRRLRSNQPAIVRRNNLLSPPDGATRSTANGNEPSDITLRPKRHGMVTPRITETPSIEETLANPMSTEATIDELSDAGDDSFTPAETPAEQGMLNIDDETLEILQAFLGDPIYKFKTATEFLHNAVFKFANDVQELVRSFDWGDDNYHLRVEFTKCGDDVFKAADALSMFSIHMSSMTMGEAMEELGEPLMKCYDTTEALARFINTHRDYLVERDVSAGVGSATLYEGLYRVDVQLANYEDLMEQLTKDRTGSTLTTMVERELADENEEEVTNKLANLSFDSETTRTDGVTPNTSFVTAMSSRSDAPMSEAEKEESMEVIRQFVRANDPTYLPNGSFPSPTEDDMRFEQIVMVHKLVVARCSELLPPACEKLQREREVSLAYYGEEHAVTRSLGLILARFEGVLQAVQTLSQRISTINTMDRAQRSSKALWKDFRRPGAEWSHAVDLVANLSLPSVTNEIKHLCKPIHQILKEATRTVAESPWATAAYDNTRGTMNGENSQFYASGSVPSTPLSAAIGPIASAAVNPGLSAREKEGPLRTASSTRINFFERADEYQRNTQRRI